MLEGFNFDFSFFVALRFLGGCEYLLVKVAGSHSQPVANVHKSHIRYAVVLRHELISTSFLLIYPFFDFEKVYVVTHDFCVLTREENPFWFPGDLIALLDTDNVHNRI